MQVLSKTQNDTLTIFLSGELDEYTANYVREKLDDLILKTKAEKIVFNCEKLEFMDSTGIGVFLGRYKKMDNFKNKIYFYGAKNNIDRVLKLSGIYSIMPKIG